MEIQFLGHAAFSISAGGSTLCIDPFPADLWEGRLNLRPITQRFDYWISSHDHPDHNGGGDLTGAMPLDEAGSTPWALSSRSAFHDEFGGRLRGGKTQLLRIRSGPITILHCGDLGERPTGALLDWLCTTPVDVLLIPTGGYYTLGPDGAAELVDQIKPSTVVPYHTRDDGLQDNRLNGVETFLRRFGNTATLSTLRVTKTQALGVVRLSPTHLSLATAAEATESSS